MIEFLHRLFSSDFMGHGYCYRWKPEIVWVHAISDGLIAVSYYFIPLMLAWLVRKRRDLPFHWIFFMFGVFILSCGTTHAMEIWTLWNGTYRLAGLIKAITAAASLATAVALVPMVPKAMLLTSPAQLREANFILEKEIAERRRVDAALQQERNFVAAVLNTVSTVIVVVDLEYRVVQCNRACELLSGRRMDELPGRSIGDLYANPDEGRRFQSMIEEWKSGGRPGVFEAQWSRKKGGERVISWSATPLPDASGQPRHIIAAGVDVTESKRLEQAILDISAREQRRIGQDLHDGLGQHLTGISFMSKVLEQKLGERQQAEATDAAKIVQLVQEALNMTRVLSRGLLPVGSDAQGLMSALERWSGEVEDRFGVLCQFTCDEVILIDDNTVSTYLYRIAQEAVNNAIKHGHATQIELRLQRTGSWIEMAIQDNGGGLPENAASRGGMGLQIMNYRAKMIGGTLEVERAPQGGTIVACQLHCPAGQAWEE